MLTFDLTSEPPTAQDIWAEQKRLQAQRKELIKSSCLSDGLHAIVFLGLYLAGFISGYGLVVAAALATIIAVILAAVTRKNLQISDCLAIGAIAVGVAAAVGFILHTVMSESATGCIVSGFTAGSIVIIGVILGRKIKQVMVSLEEIKSIAEDEYAQQEVASICRLYPEMESYRQQALRILRPNLTYGELWAMQKWATSNRPSKSSAP